MHACKHASLLSARDRCPDLPTKWSIFILVECFGTCSSGLLLMSWQRSEFLDYRTHTDPGTPAKIRETRDIVRYDTLLVRGLGIVAVLTNIMASSNGRLSIDGRNEAFWQQRAFRTLTQVRCTLMHLKYTNVTATVPGDMQD